MLRYLRIVEPVLYVLASVFGMVKAAQEIRTAVTEREPTFFTAEQFPKEYQGQRWIGVTGRVAIDHKFLRRSRYRAHQGKMFVYVSVPIVPRDWKPDRPIHVIATFGPLRPWDVEKWSRRWERGDTTSIVGKVRPSGFRDPASMFPNAVLGKPLVTINEGTAPNPVLSLSLFLGMMILFAWLAVRKIRYLLSVDHL